MVLFIDTCQNTRGNQSVSTSLVLIRCLRYENEEISDGLLNFIKLDFLINFELKND